MTSRVLCAFNYNTLLPNKSNNRPASPSRHLPSALKDSVQFYPDPDIFYDRIMHYSTPGISSFLYLPLCRSNPPVHCFGNVLWYYGDELNKIESFVKWEQCTRYSNRKIFSTEKRKIPHNFLIHNNKIKLNNNNIQKVLPKEWRNKGKSSENPLVFWGLTRRKCGGGRIQAISISNGRMLWERKVYHHLDLLEMMEYYANQTAYCC